jgi:hypothetical protein
VQADVGVVDIAIDNVTDSIADGTVPERICSGVYRIQVGSAHGKQPGYLVFRKRSALACHVNGAGDIGIAGAAA